MKYLSVCSGIETATLAFQDLNWEPIGFSEIDGFPNALLTHHYPHVKNYGDMTKFKEWKDVPDFNVLIGGTPCQSFSAAGLREGLADPRGRLMLTFGAIADRYRPQWVVWENVRDVLSTNNGNGFRTFLAMFAQLGYGFAYRVFNAQYFGVPQRRRRVIFVGYLGDWRPPAAVLFESQSFGRDTQKGRTKGKTGSPYSRKSAESNGPEGKARALLADGHKLDADTETFIAQRIANPLMAKHTRSNIEENLIPMAFAMRGRKEGNVPEVSGQTTSAIRGSSGGSSRDLVAFSSKNAGQDVGDVSPPIRAGNNSNSKPNGGTPPAIAFAQNSRDEVRLTDQASPLTTGGGKPGQGFPAVLTEYVVRRLTPMECERLQGIPDKYTAIPYKKKKVAADSHRYKAVGNGMCVPKIRWIGQRIELVQSVIDELKENELKQSKEKPTNQ